MILPIVAYGSPVLRKVGVEITRAYEGLDQLIADMWETMYNSNGVGLAAPQVDRSIRLFVMDSEQMFANDEEGDMEEFSDAPGYKGVFINPRIQSVEGELWSYNEGCLSIPKIREDIMRHEQVTITFRDEHFIEQTKTFNGITARIILHEYDHIEGKLFIDYIKPLKRTLMRRKLEDISKGKVQVNYRMKFVR